MMDTTESGLDIANSPSSSSCFYLPGDVLPIDLKATQPSRCAAASTSNTPKQGKKIMGPGVCVQRELVAANRAGLLRAEADQITCWIDYAAKRYLPAKGDKVIGTVTARLTDGWKLDIGAAEQASVSALAFEGSTKKNRPNVKVGDLLYAQLTIATKDMEPEAVCVGSDFRARGLGTLPSGGMLFTVSQRLCRRLLSGECALFSLLGQQLKFEVTIGMNGRVWIKSFSARQTIQLGQALREADTPRMQSSDALKQLVERTLAIVHGL